MGLGFAVAATADLTLGLGWGWEWEAIPAGILFAAVAAGFYWVSMKIADFVEWVDP
jgi:hypothetical protein